MFNMTGSEVMFLLIIGLVVLGPEKLPEAIRRMGKLYAELKRMSSGVQTDFRKVMDEPLKEMMSTTNSMKALFTDTAGEFQSAAKEIIEPTFIPYQSSNGDAESKIDANDSSDEENDDDDTDIAEGIANAARIAQQRIDQAIKQSKINATKTVKPKKTATKSTKKLPAKRKPVKKQVVKKTQPKKSSPRKLNG